MIGIVNTRANSIYIRECQFDGIVYYIRERG